MSDGLRHAFNQNPKVDTNDNHPTEDKGAPAFDKKEEKAFVAASPNGNLYNTENDKPVKMEIPQAMEGSNRREVDRDRLEHAEVGKEVSYSGGVGTVVERRGMFLTIYNKDIDTFDKVHAGETYVPGDAITMGGLNKYWDDITAQNKLDLLTNVNIPILKDFQYRRWSQIPRDIQDVIKNQPINKEGPYMGEPSHGGMEGREPAHTGRNEESQSFRDVTQPAHVTRPYKDKPAKGFSKSDVEQGWYGGISTTQDPMDANDDYEDKRPKRRLTGAQEEADKKPATVGSPRQRIDPNKPRSQIHYNQQEGYTLRNPNKASQDLTAITGEPNDGKKEEDKEKATQDLTAITGEPNHGEKKDDEVEKQITPREKANAESTRWGVRYGVTLREFEERR